MRRKSILTKQQTEFLMKLLKAEADFHEDNLKQPIPKEYLRGVELSSYINRLGQALHDKGLVKIKHYRSEKQLAAFIKYKPVIQFLEGELSQLSKLLNSRMHRRKRDDYEAERAALLRYLKILDDNQKTKTRVD